MMDGQMTLFEELRAPEIPSFHGGTRVGTRPNSKVLGDSIYDYLGCDYSLNPYVGCGFGCSYCYAAFYVPEEDRRADWGKWVDVKTDAERQIAKADLKGMKILMATATDAYQPLEAKVELTRRIVELLSEPKRQPLLRIQTRSPIASRDIDLFQRFRSIRVNMSITTDSDDIRKRFEPSCASIERRFEAIEQIGRAGISIGISVAPTLPMQDPEAFAKRIAALKPDRVFTGRFHVAQRDFRASTRQGAIDLAKEYGWDEKSYDATVATLKRHLPRLNAR